MLRKHFVSEIKGLDEAEGYVEAYPCVYNNVDSDNDISMPGCMVKTATENFKKIRVYKNHSGIIIGVPKSIDANDMYGLKTGTQFNLKTDDGRNMFWDVKMIHDNGQDADLSFGYEVMKRNEKDKRRIEEYKLWEYSFLTTWGANPMSTVTGMKSMTDVMEHLTKMYNLPYSDTRLIQIENILKSLDKEPPQDGTLLSEPIKPIISFNQFRAFNAAR